MTGSIQRSPEEVQRAYRAFMERVAQSPWGMLARRILTFEVSTLVLHEDGRIERGSYSDSLQRALDEHDKYVRELAARYGFEVAP